MATEIEISIHTWISVPRLSACSLVFESRKSKEDTIKRQLYWHLLPISIIISFPNPKLTHHIFFILLLPLIPLNSEEEEENEKPITTNISNNQDQGEEQ